MAQGKSPHLQEERASAQTTALFQLSGWWFLTFTGTEVKEKIRYLTGVQFLYDTINPDQIEIPKFVTDFDKAVSFVNAVPPMTIMDNNVFF